MTSQALWISWRNIQYKLVGLLIKCSIELLVLLLHLKELQKSGRLLFTVFTAEEARESGEESGQNQ